MHCHNDPFCFGKQFDSNGLHVNVVGALRVVGPQVCLFIYTIDPGATRLSNNYSGNDGGIAIAEALKLTSSITKIE